MTDATPNPTAAVLVIGDEILSGRTADTNTNTIAKFLTERGIDLQEARVVGDRQAQIVEALDALRSAYDYVFTTGGIGPTHDDITADAVAAAFKVGIAEHPDALALLERRYGDQLNAARRRMARIPEGASLIANPVTDAPGFQFENVFVMAGVPKIMAAMLEDVAPRLKGGTPTLSRTLTVVGTGEGTLAAPLETTAGAYPDLSFGSYPFGAGTGRVGANLVVRGSEAVRVEEAVERLRQALAELGIEGRL
jgi:molybdenum cofactor synthesis domain-containing protein